MIANEEYLEHSLKFPQEVIVQGYPEIMPPFNLSEEELHAIVEYLKTMK